MVITFRFHYCFFNNIPSFFCIIFMLNCKARKVILFARFLIDWKSFLSFVYSSSVLLFLFPKNFYCLWHHPNWFYIIPVLFKHFDCVFVDDSFSNIWGFVFFSGSRCRLQKTNKKMVWNINFRYKCFKISIYKRIYKNMIYYSWSFPCNLSKFVYCWNKDVLID